MGIEFNRIITLLRKERGITQKQAAQDLGISQAQLSHYEKGIRECGLAFVVQVADYYDVSVMIRLNSIPTTCPRATPPPAAASTEAVSCPQCTKN